MNVSGNEYQKLAARTLIDEPLRPLTSKETMILWNAMGIGGESGEILENIKKAVFHQHGLDVAKITEELGDLLWYVSALATILDIDLETIMASNIGKLKARYPQGFSTERSQHRQE